MYKNKVKHNNDGTTTIFIESKRKGWEGTHEAIIDTEEFFKHEDLFKQRSVYLLAPPRGPYPYANINILHPDGGWYENPNTGKKSKRSTQLLLHHLILGKPPEGELVDHKNHNGLDNRKENIKFVNPSQNGANTRRPANNTSGYKGVHWCKRQEKFLARIKFKQISKYIGCFTCKHEAALAYNKKAREFWGDHAFLNEVPEEWSLKYERKKETEVPCNA